MSDRSNPIPHDNPSAGPRYAHHLLGYIEWLWCKHGTKDANDQIERIVLELVQVRGVALLKLTIRKAQLLGASVPRLNEVPRDIDTQYFGSKFRCRNRGCSVATSEVQDLSPFVIPSLLTRTSPLSLMLAAIRVKSPFSQSAWFGFIGSLPLLRSLGFVFLAKDIQ